MPLMTSPRPSVKPSGASSVELQPHAFPQRHPRKSLCGWDCSPVEGDAAVESADVARLEPAAGGGWGAGAGLQHAVDHKQLLRHIHWDWSCVEGRLCAHRLRTPLSPPLRSRGWASAAVQLSALLAVGSASSSSCSAATQARRSGRERRVAIAGWASRWGGLGLRARYAAQRRRPWQRDRRAVPRLLSDLRIYGSGSIIRTSTNRSRYGSTGSGYGPIMIYVGLAEQSGLIVYPAPGA